MKLSIIIPTHNRADSLSKAMQSVLALQGEAHFEFIIVDNNSTDNTRKTVEKYAGVARYVFEENTAFSKARSTGADHANGDVLVFMDDDIIVNPGALKAVISVFERYPNCGIVASKILPLFESEPPDWAVACQRTFNGWSLYNPDIAPRTGIGFQEVKSAAGPMMAVSRRAYDSAEGFPPDTVGVETNTTNNSFRKLYIGPGDYGLCHIVRNKGFKIYYSPDTSCYHFIPKIRFSIPFWRSRMIGEGQHEAITARIFFNLSKFNLKRKQTIYRLQYFRWRKKLSKRLAHTEKFLAKQDFKGMFFEEIWIQYYNAYNKMESVLQKNPGLSEFLWEIGKNGVSDNEFESVVSKFPREFCDLVDSSYMYNEKPINSTNALREFERNFKKSSP
jgi:glycosyltransferase involved in cell wall biosynthesis